MQKIKVPLIIFCILLIATPAFAITQAEVQRLAVQYDLHQAIVVFSGFLQRGWHNYGSVTVPENWNHAYLVIVPYAESGHRISVKVNGYDVIIGRPLSSTITADITNYVNLGDTARIDIYCTGSPRVGIFLAPPNTANHASSNSSTHTTQHVTQTEVPMVFGLDSINDTINFVKYGLIGIGILVVVVLAVVLLHRR